ncbi:unnamed protein product [Ranitomeya imitator]|uniref:Chromo domain-containing protein n=1 Tax=Ranitomeya imitator TaxID=111125 RepID=A0ABN9LGV8_9NEOB|nr:unnamed protein product [Ranitomeya imitator]
MVPSVDPPAPVLVEGELEYIVEKILDSRVSRRKLQYLVKLKGYAQEDNSWVFASDVHAPDLVRAFHVAHPGRPGGSGKSTLTESLKSQLNAMLLKSPPDSINQWRKIFDSESSLIKRAYYAIGNYIGAAEIAKASITSPVIVDRFWHSTAAYAIATEVGGGICNLPDAHHDVYHWPQDLLQPDLVILLTVSDEERIRRIRKRGLEETKEEKELEDNSIFRQNPASFLFRSLSLPLGKPAAHPHGSRHGAEKAPERAVCPALTLFWVPYPPLQWQEKKDQDTVKEGRIRVEEVYKRMENPRCVIIDAGPSMENVLQEALSAIKKHCDL